MPKYNNKQRLKQIIESGKELNPLTRHLILEGFSYNEAIEGLEPFVSRWEQAVKYIEESSVNDNGYSEEYNHDLHSRSRLYEILKYASAEELNRYKHRISQADLIFENTTVDSNTAIRHLKNPDKEEQWWLFRVKI